ncbi:MAG TPA: enoyl-CoA hydratase/isomerase family protein, partial [Spirochaetia bacterium]
MIQIVHKEVAGSSGQGHPGGATPPGKIARIILDRPEKKNALTPQMLVRLVEAVRETCTGADGQPGSVRAIVLEGNGAAFCSGFDLTLCRENPDALGQLLAGLSGVVRVLRECPVPVLLAAHGAAIAGGCALLGGADLVVTHTDAKIGYPVVRLGISPAVSAPFLRQSVGDGRTRERMLDTALMSGWDAMRLGLAHECLEDAGKVRDRALALAEQLAAKPPWGLTATKRWLGDIDGSFGDAPARG